MQVTQTILERLENMLKWYGHVVCMEDNSWEKNDLVIGTKTTSRSKVGKVSWEIYEAEDFNLRKCTKPTTMTIEIQ
jgi:hypothetical protein